MKNRHFIATLTVLVCFLLQLSCSTKECGCGPPPDYRFALVDKNDKSWIDKSNKDSLKITYKQGILVKQVENIRIEITDSAGTKEFNHIVSATQLIYTSSEANDPVFDVELQGKLLGKIHLKTIRNNPERSGWTTISEVLFNGKKPVTSKTYYLDIFKTD